MDYQNCLTVLLWFVFGKKKCFGFVNVQMIAQFVAVASFCRYNTYGENLWTVGASFSVLSAYLVNVKYVGEMG